MALLKFKISASQIITFYNESCCRIIKIITNCVYSINNLKKAVKKRIRKDKNLSDLGAPGQSKDVWQAQARTNLEIVGDDVTTHNHDDLYDNMIKEMRTRIHARENELSKLISSFRNCDGHCQRDAEARAKQQGALYWT